ncbi:MAG: hypothetical protein AAFY26_19505 [Cyanobacteria bacterium J06638_22]
MLSNQRYVQQQRLKSCRRMLAWQIERLSKTEPQTLAHIEQGLRDLSQAEYAEQRAQRLRQRGHNGHVLPLRWHLPVKVVIAGIGALVCSASVQTTTLTLPRWLQTPATPLIAGVLVLGSEELARKSMTTLRMTQVQAQEVQQLTQAIERIDDTYPLEIIYREAQLELLMATEARPWPFIEAATVGLIFLLESGSALFWVASESLALAAFAAIAPIGYVLLAAVLLSHVLDGDQELEAVAGLYERHLIPQAFAPELVQAAVSEVEALTTGSTPHSHQNNGYASESMLEDLF